ncbi:hypothetical protein ACFSKN_13025 [Mariniflexile gromovii]|uniref:DUF3037 family protein n=1 Tax=Mariniflexile gromovii TaxID=362523 RepID=A0ABS4BW17_9FLAO|nr:hypothetical protein [Mariniflexile gromovii]MBP0904785.1 hypothetical protein [Mariniflexile gromovii]
MKSHYSIIRFVNNPLSKENLAIGMILISNNKLFYKFSKEKINLAHKINNSNGNLLDYTIKKISDFIDFQLKEEVCLFSKEVSVNLEYLNRLSIYNNGFLQFDNPMLLNLDFDNEKFNNFFKKYIELNLKPQQKAVIDRTFIRTIRKVFYEPLYNVIDLNYKIKKEQIPNLFFDYTLDGIGVNGSVYSVKSIDLNSEKPIDSLRHEISDLESLNYRLDLFSKENNLNFHDNSHYLVIDPYKGSKSSYHKLYEILMEQNDNDYPYSIIGTDSLPLIASNIKNSNSIIKFSDFIEKKS